MKTNPMLERFTAAEDYKILKSLCRDYDVRDEAWAHEQASLAHNLGYIGVHMCITQNKTGFKPPQVEAVIVPDAVAYYFRISRAIGGPSRVLPLIDAINPNGAEQTASSSDEELNDVYYSQSRSTNAEACWKLVSGKFLQIEERLGHGHLGDQASLENASRMATLVGARAMIYLSRCIMDFSEMYSIDKTQVLEQRLENLR